MFTIELLRVIEKKKNLAVFALMTRKPECGDN